MRLINCWFVDIFARPYATAALTRAMMPKQVLKKALPGSHVRPKFVATSTFSAYPPYATGFVNPPPFANNPFAPRFRG